jgi:hypothetical protein
VIAPAERTRIVPVGRGGKRRTGGARPPGAITPLLRLAGLVALAILVIVLLVFWVKSCQGSGKNSRYAGYMGNVTVVAKESEQIGRELNDALTTPGIKPADLDAKLSGLAQQQAQGVARAQALSPPGPLRFEQQDLVKSLQLRVSGLRGVGAALRTAARSPKDTAGNALLVSSQAQRLVAGDVLWEDLFKAPSVSVLRAEGVTGVPVPDSNVVTSPDFASPRYWEAILQRLFNTTATGGAAGGLHGTGLVSTKALPSNQELSPTQETTVTATTDLGFAVTIEDTGDSQEVQVKVTLTIQQSPSPIVQTKTIDLINPGEQKTVLFRNLGQVQFATRTTVKVDVQPVPGEKNTSNNSASYPVIFSLG